MVVRSDRCGFFIVEIPTMISPPFDQIVTLRARLPQGLNEPSDFAQFNRQLTRAAPGFRLQRQTPELLQDELSFEARIAELGVIATRPGSLHDFYSALMWLRYPRVKQAINAIHMQGIREHGVKQRSRHQQAVTHLDEAGAWIFSDSDALLELADQHAWEPLFWQQAQAWRCQSELGSIRAAVFGHAIYELMHAPHQTLAAKTIWVKVSSDFFELDVAEQDLALDSCIATALLAGTHGNDPKPLATLPVSGIPGWNARTGEQEFYRNALFPGASIVGSLSQRSQG